MHHADCMHLMHQTNLHQSCMLPLCIACHPHCPPNPPPSSPLQGTCGTLFWMRPTRCWAWASSRRLRRCARCCCHRAMRQRLRASRAARGPRSSAACRWAGRAERWGQARLRLEPSIRGAPCCANHEAASASGSPTRPSPHLTTCPTCPSPSSPTRWASTPPPCPSPWLRRPPSGCTAPSACASPPPPPASARA